MSAATPRTPRAIRPEPEIPVALVGCDFRVASAAWRSALVLTPQERQALAERLAQSAGLRAFAVVDTCNRTEWIVETPHPAWAAELLRAWMQRRFRGLAADGPLPQPYVHVGADAARHFVRVAVGLESFVPGEREIAGQCVKALLVARAENLASPLLDELSKSAGRAVRRLERLGRFRDATRGVHALGADLVQRKLEAARPDGLRGARIAVAGMGMLGRKIHALLEGRGARMSAFNRTPRPPAPVRPLDDLPAALADLDVLVVATGAMAALFDLPAQQGRERPLLVVDLGVPCQVAASRREGLDHAGLDDLQAADAAGPSAEDLSLAEELAENAVTEVLLANARRTSAQVIAAAQTKRDELRDERLPALLDDQLPELNPLRRRRLEQALRSLMSEQHRVLLEEVERRAAGTLPGAPPPAPASAEGSVQ